MGDIILFAGLGALITGGIVYVGNLLNDDKQ